MFECVEYQLRSVARLHWACWDDEYVVFDETSGQTHQLDPLRAFVLHLLSERSQTFSAITRVLSALPAFPADFCANEILRTVINEFEARGLVEVVEK